METQVITINETEYSLKFGYGALRALGEVWGVPSLVQVGEKIADSFAGFDGVDLSFEQIDVMAAMVFSALIAQDAAIKKQLSIDDVAAGLMEQPDALTNVLTAYMAAMPKAVGKPQPAAIKKPKKK